MLYLLLIVIPAMVGLVLGFGLPKVVMAVWRHNHLANRTKNITKNERRLICIR